MRDLRCRDSSVSTCQPFLWRAAVVLVISASASAQISHHLNLPQTLAPIKAAIDTGQEVDIVAVGDSFTMRSDSWLPVFRTALQTLYGDAGAGYQGISTRNGFSFFGPWAGGLPDADPSPHRALDGLWVETAANTTPAPLASLNANGTHYEVQFACYPGGGGFRMVRASDSATLGIFSTNAPTPVVGTWTHEFTDGSRLLRVETLGDGPVTLLGVINTIDQPGVRVHRVANGGWGVRNYLQRDWTFDPQFAALGAELVYIWLGGNDWMLTPDDFALKLGQVVDRVQAAAPAAKILLVASQDSGSPHLALFAPKVRAIAQARGLGFIDLYNAIGRYEFFQDSGMLSDAVHFNQIGGDYVGSIMVDAFLTDGENLTVLIDQHPRSVLQPICTFAVFSVTLAPGVNPISYQWRKDGVPLPESSTEVGVNTAQLSVEANAFAQIGQYDVVVTTDQGVEQSRFGLLRLVGVAGCLGDANGDNRVDFDDILTVLSTWGNQYYPEDCVFGVGDANSDLHVDFDDFSMILRRWDMRCE